MSTHTHTADTLRAFEANIAALWNAGELPCVTHLCGGNEAQLLDLFTRIKPGDWILSTHRNHYHALLAGIPPERLEGLIRFGRSMYVFSKEHNFLSTAILAGQCAIAAGLALSIAQQGLGSRVSDLGSNPDPKPQTPAPRLPHVWCFLGDGAEEEGHFYEAALFVESQDLPCTFIIEDNNYQMDTPKTERRGDDFGDWLPTHEPLDHFNCVERYHYQRTYPHAGTGQKITLKPEAIARLKPQG